MAKELTLDVVAKKNSKALSELADEFDKLSKQVDDSGKSMQKHATFSAYLEDQLAKTKVQVRELGAEFDRTGSKDVFAKLKGAQANLKSLEAIGKQLEKAIGTGVEDGLTEGAQQGEQSFFQVLKDLPPQVQAALVPTLVGAVVIASPAIGAALDGALLAGVGLGGIAAGIVGQIHDPEVQKAFGDLKTTGMDVLTASTKSFAPILTDAAHEFQDLLLKAEPKLQAAFDRLAPHAAAIFQGLEGFGSKAAPGLFEALDAAGPILDQIGRDLPGLGNAFSTFFHAIAGGAPGAKDALHELFLVIEATVEGVGYLVEGLSKSFTVLEAFGELVKGNVGGAGVILGDLTTNSHTAADATAHITEKFRDGAVAAGLEAAAVEKLNGNLSTLIGNQLSVAQANDNFQKGLNDLGKALDQNNHTLVGNSDAAIQNREAIIALITQAEQAREAQIKMAGGADASKESIDKANASYEQAIAKIEDVGVKAHLSKKDLDNLAGQYDINVILAVDEINNSPLAQLTHAHDPGRYGSAGPPKRAAGGPAVAGQTYMVNERGIEYFTPRDSGYITPADQAAALMNRSAGTVINLTVNAGIGTDGAAVGRQIVAALRPAIASAGGNVQRVLGQGS